MARHPFQPDPVEGAARYWADGKHVIMRDPAGGNSCIQTCKSDEAACNAAVRWQKKENAAVTKEAKRRAKLGIKPEYDSEYPPGYMQGRGAA